MNTRYKIPDTRYKQILSWSLVFVFKKQNPADTKQRGAEKYE